MKSVVAAREAPPRAVAVVLGWAVPGLGHWLMGARVRGAIVFAAIGLTFWVGVAVGGVRSTIDPVNNRAWFVAQICCGANTVAGLVLRRAVPDRLPYTAGWPALDIGIVYTGVAGLLNLLAVLDLIGGGGAGGGPAGGKPE